MGTLEQHSFTGGELSPALGARVDTLKYATGLKLCRNNQVMRYGGVQNRPGTTFLAEVKDSTKAVRLIPFEFNSSQTYVLEFGEQYMRVYKNGVRLGAPYEIATPYLAADLASLHYAQSGDVLTIVHSNYEPRELVRLADTSWTLSVIRYIPKQANPPLTQVTGSAGAAVTTYMMTAVSPNGDESIPGISLPINITGVTLANPAVVTSVAHNKTDGSLVYIDTFVGGMTEMNDRVFVIKVIDADHFSLVGVDGTLFSAYSSGGRAQTLQFSYGGAAPSGGTPINVFTATAAAGAYSYNIYKKNGSGIFGFIGTTTSLSFVDTGFNPDITQVPPVFRNVFMGLNNWPTTVGYYQQRRLFANTTNNPDTVWASAIADVSNFSAHATTQDDDTLQFSLTGRQVNSVKHLVDVGKLLLFSSGGEWAVLGDSSNALTPAAINTRQYSYNGSSSLQPIVINNNAIYLQARGTIFRDLSFDFQIDGYRGNDLTLFSNHLFDGYSVLDWAYAQVPNSVIWAVRSDGKLLGLTYVPEQQIIGWHQHDTDGYYENVCSVSEGSENVLYVVVRRTINGVSKRYVERVNTRLVADIRDAVFVDCSLGYDGRNVGVKTLTLTTGAGWTHADSLTLTASAAQFSAGDVGLEYFFYNAASALLVRCVVTAYISNTVVTVSPDRAVPIAIQGAASTAWARAANVFTGLSHLEGKQVSALGDGFAVANPNNDSYNVVTVTAGQVTLDKCYAVVHVGLPYTSDLETLDVNTANGETWVDKKKMFGKVTMRVAGSRGGFVGGSRPSSDVLDDTLREIKYSRTDYDSPIALLTEAVEVVIRPEWNSNGRIFVRQSDPLPMTILSVAPAGHFPGA